MKKLNVLFISGSLGLGHIGRDMAIANSLRKIMHDADIDWIAADPATKVLVQQGEKLVPGIEGYSNENISAEESSKNSSLNLLKYLIKAKSKWEKNTEFFKKVISSKNYDIVIGDETYEINLFLRKHPELKKFPFVLILDFVGLDAMTINPLEQLGVYYWNRVWSNDYRLKRKPPYDLALFIGEERDIPDKSFGFMLPNRRELAKSMYKFVGYIFPFNVSEYSNKQEIRERLGYGNEKLIICSIGGTSIGKELLELCGQAFELIRKQIPGLHFIVNTGPRLSAKSLNLPKDIEVKEFIPRLYEHFASCDLAIVQGGATSTLELTALKKPFIYFPIQGHCEQENVSRILTQRGTGTRMNLVKTTPSILADKIVSLLNLNVTYPDIPTDRDQKAAKLIYELLFLSAK